MFRSIMRNRSGMTLVEVVIVLALISLILAGAFFIFAFGNNTFSGGTNQRNLQADVRMALETLTHDVRYATRLEILSAGAIDIATLQTSSGSGIYAAVAPYQTYIFYDSSKDAVVRLQRETLTNVSFKTDADNPLIFKLKGSPATALTYQVDGANSLGSKQFDIASTIMMLNILDQNGLSRATGISDGVAIRYTTPEDNIAEMQYPETQLVGINNDSAVEISFNKSINLNLTDNPFEVIPGTKSNSLTTANVAIAPQGVSTKLKIDFVKVGSKPTSFVDGDTIVLTLTYGPSLAVDDYTAVYSLVFMGGSTKKWVIE